MKILERFHEAVIEFNFKRGIRGVMDEFPFITEDTAEKLVICGWSVIGDELITIPERVRAKHRGLIERRDRDLNYLKKHVFNGVLPDKWSEIEPEFTKLRLGRGSEDDPADLVSKDLKGSSAASAKVSGNPLDCKRI